MDRNNYYPYPMGAGIGRPLRQPGTGFGGPWNQQNYTFYPTPYPAHPSFATAYIPPPYRPPVPLLSLPVCPQPQQRFGFRGRYGAPNPTTHARPPNTSMTAPSSSFQSNSLGSRSQPQPITSNGQVKLEPETDTTNTQITSGQMGPRVTGRPVITTAPSAGVTFWGRGVSSPSFQSHSGSSTRVDPAESTVAPFGFVPQDLGEPMQVECAEAGEKLLKVKEEIGAETQHKMPETMTIQEKSTAGEAGRAKKGLQKPGQPANKAAETQQKMPAREKKAAGKSGVQCATCKKTLTTFHEKTIKQHVESHNRKLWKLPMAEFHERYSELVQLCFGNLSQAKSTKKNLVLDRNQLVMERVEEVRSEAANWVAAVTSSSQSEQLTDADLNQANIPGSSGVQNQKPQKNLPSASSSQKQNSKKSRKRKKKPQRDSATCGKCGKDISFPVGTLIEECQEIKDHVASHIQSAWKCRCGHTARSRGRAMRHSGAQRGENWRHGFAHVATVSAGFGERPFDEVFEEMMQMCFDEGHQGAPRAGDLGRNGRSMTGKKPHKGLLGHPPPELIQQMRNSHYDETKISIDCLEDGVLLEIFKLLDKKNLFKLLQVSKRWEALVERQCLLIREFSGAIFFPVNPAQIAARLLDEEDSVEDFLDEYRDAWESVSHFSWHEMLSVIKHCPRLRVLDLSGLSRVKSAAVRAPPGQNPSYDLNGENMKKIHNFCPNIEVLNLHKLWVKPAGIRQLGLFDKLEDLNLKDMMVMDGIKGGGFDGAMSQALKGMRNLIRLNLNSIHLDGTCLEFVNRDSLEVLDLTDNQQLTEKGFRSLTEEEWPALKELNIAKLSGLEYHVHSEDKFLDIGPILLNLASRMPNLVSIDLSCSMIRHDRLEELGKLPNLENIGFAYVKARPATQLAEALLEILTAPTCLCRDKITKLDLTLCRVNEKTLKDIGDLSSLKELVLCGEKSVMMNGLEGEGGGGGVSDGTVFAIAYGCRNLERLTLRGFSGLTNGALATIGSYCAHLSYLDIIACRQVTPEGILSLLSGLKSSDKRKKNAEIVVYVRGCSILSEWDNIDDENAGLKVELDKVPDLHDTISPWHIPNGMLEADEDIYPDSDLEDPDMMSDMMSDDDYMWADMSSDEDIATGFMRGLQHYKAMMGFKDSYSDDYHDWIFGPEGPDLDDLFNFR